MAAPGLRHTDPDVVALRLRDVVTEVWTGVVTTSSNFARKNALYFGAAASMQLITTRVASGVYRGAWNVTPKGLAWLNETEND